jgi:hypothetical protein
VIARNDKGRKPKGLRPHIQSCFGKPKLKCLYTPIDFAGTLGQAISEGMRQQPSFKKFKFSGKCSWRFVVVFT